MNYPKVYFLVEKDDKYEIYFGEYSTLDGIKLLDKDLKIKIEEFGATNYKNFGFATENDIPKLETIGEFISFLENVDFIDIIHCKIKLIEIGNLSTHDDGECHFILDSKERTFDLIKKSSPIAYQDKILSELINNQNKYITIDLNGNVEIYFTFHDYIKNSL